MLSRRSNPDAVIGNRGGFVTQHEHDLVVDVDARAPEEKLRVRAHLGERIEHELERHLATGRLRGEERVSPARAGDATGSHDDVLTTQPNRRPKGAGFYALRHAARFMQ